MLRCDQPDRRRVARPSRARTRGGGGADARGATGRHRRAETIGAEGAQAVRSPERLNRRRVNLQRACNAVEPARCRLCSETPGSSNRPPALSGVARLCAADSSHRQTIEHRTLKCREIPRPEEGWALSPEGVWSTVAPIDADSRERAARVKAAKAPKGSLDARRRSRKMRQGATVQGIASLKHWEDGEGEARVVRRGTGKRREVASIPRTRGRRSSGQ
jgi:hypothetical protein